MSLRSSIRPGNRRGTDRRRGRRHRCDAVLFEAVEPRTLLTTYYVSPGGSDSAAGTSTSAPFKSITKVNTLNLNAGDKVFFEGGQTFNAPSPSAISQVNDGGF